MNFDVFIFFLSLFYLLLFKIYIQIYFFIAGLAVYRAEAKRRRRYRRRTNSFIAAMRICRNYRHYPRERMPAHCRNIIRHTGNRYHENGPTIVIIEK
jgi:hypothetical protein